MVSNRIVVVGGGLAGLSTAWHLAQFGARDVVVVERERELGTQASAQNAAIVRTAIDDAPMRELAQRGARFLNEPPPGFSLQKLVAGDGLIVLSSANVTWEHGERIDSVGARRRLPALSKAAENGWFFAQEGRVDVRVLIAAFAEGARAAGVRFVLDARVRAIREQGLGVELASGETIEAERCVLAAGAWAAPLARAVGSRVELTPTRRHLLVTRRDAAIDPRWPAVWSDDDEFYARPDSGGWMLCPCDEDAVDPDRLTATHAALESATSKARAILNSADIGQPAKFWAGLRTHAADRRFVIGRDSHVPNLIWAAGLGGHGVTCAAVVGELAARAALCIEEPRAIAGPFSPTRFETP
ncbi:MAG: FAD-dependent oxidoreductase [Planctomycetota bacterium]|nr:FAD-dependent oxidoreductase [Planctomycetota bacterium]